MTWGYGELNKVLYSSRPSQKPRVRVGKKAFIIKHHNKTSHCATRKSITSHSAVSEEAQQHRKWSSAQVRVTVSHRKVHVLRPPTPARARWLHS